MKNPRKQGIPINWQELFVEHFAHPAADERRISDPTLVDWVAIDLCLQA